MRSSRRARGSATIADVAAAAGVSPSTVSRAIRGHPDVGEQTRAQVLASVDTLRYRPSTLARALASGRSQTVGLLVSDIANPFYPRLAKAVERECRKRHYSLVICNTDDSELESVEYIERLTDQGVEGFIHASVGIDEGPVLEALRDAKRIVFANRRPRSESVSYVVSNNEAGGRQLGEHLVSLGHRRIGFVAGPSWASSVEERRRGLSQALEDCGGQLLVAEGDFAATKTPQAVQALLAAAIPPTAIVGINDRVAGGVYGLLLDLGLHVPGEMALAGFDNIDFGWVQALSLTTVAQRTDTMGRRAVEILLRQLDKPSVRITRQELPMDLLVRGTTDAGQTSSRAEVP